MDLGFLPSRYAKALYESALEKGLSKGVYEAMRNLESMFNSPDGDRLTATVANPYVDETEKMNLVISACGKVDDNQLGVDSIVGDFMKLLFKNRRLDLVRGVALAYISLYRKKNEIRRVTVEWASRPEESTEDQMKSLVQRHIGNAKMEYNSVVNPDLIGGYRIAIDNERLDASVANEFNQLRQKLLSK